LSYNELKIDRKVRLDKEVRVCKNDIFWVFSMFLIAAETYFFPREILEHSIVDKLAAIVTGAENWSRGALEYYEVRFLWLYMIFIFPITAVLLFLNMGLTLD